METTTLELGPVIDVDKLDTAKPLAEIFLPYKTTLEKWSAKAASLVVTDIGQKAEMQMARVARLELREARVSMEKTRKNLVSGLKERTTKIDTAARIVREKIEDLEETLRASEEFAERYAAQQQAELKAKREAELAPLIDYQIVTDLSDLSDNDWAAVQEMTSEEYLEGRGEDARLVKRTKIKLHGKEGPLVVVRSVVVHARDTEPEPAHVRNSAQPAEAGRSSSLGRRVEQTADIRVIPG